jgi:hypothetical protein
MARKRRLPEGLTEAALEALTTAVRTPAELEVRRLLYSTNAIESLHMTLRKTLAGIATGPRDDYVFPLPASRFPLPASRQLSVIRVPAASAVSFTTPRASPVSTRSAACSSSRLCRSSPATWGSPSSSANAIAEP